MEQVVQNKEMGKPVSPSKVAFVRKWASPPNQSALIPTYRMRGQRSFELPGELGQEGSSLYPVHLPVRWGS